MSKLQYFLSTNNFIKAQDKDLYARVVDTPLVNTTDLASRIVEKSEWDYNTIFSILNLYYDEVKDTIRKCERIETPIFTSNFSIKGRFATSEDVFDPSRHQKCWNINIPKELAKELDNIHVEKITRQNNLVEITDLMDSASGTRNTQLTPGGILEIMGYNLRVSKNVEAGVYFKEISTKEEIKADYVSTNNPRHISVPIPALTTGNWTVIVKTSASDNGTIRIGEYTTPLVVLV